MEIEGALKGKKVTSIADGAAHALALDEERNVYSWKRNSNDGWESYKSSIEKAVLVFSLKDYLKVK
jgi:alpha-tubulin suppressor-like RCC1 family protein